MEILTFHNTKLGGTIPQLNMPVGVSCRKNAPCAGICYAKKGNMAFTNVKKAHMKRYNLYKQDPDAFFQQIIGELRLSCATLMRCNAAGDIPDERFLQGLVDVANACPNVLIWVPTKKYELVNAYADTHEIPTNLRIMLSTYGKWVPPNPHNFVMAWVRFKAPLTHMNELIPTDAFVCPKRCGECPSKFCWTAERGQHVIFDKH